MPKFDTQYTREIICLYCGHAEHDSWEVDFGDGLEGEIDFDCSECGKRFRVSRVVDISYVSNKAKESDV
jgi:transcription elongation factor Elf1